MRMFLKWIIASIALSGIIYLVTLKELDFKQFLKWELILIVILCVVIWLFFKWQRSMRLEETTVCIQFLDD